MAKKWPGMFVQRSFIKGHSFRKGLYSPDYSRNATYLQGCIKCVRSPAMATDQIANISIWSANV